VLPAGAVAIDHGVAHGRDEHAHNPNLQHHFYSMEQQLEASTLGMWVFLVTEIMFFGGMFMAYILYRVTYPEAWIHGSNHLNVVLGALNTTVLICSSLTMVLAVRSAQVGSRRGQIVNLILTILFGTTFLVIKYFEYKEKFEHHLVPGPSFNATGIIPAGDDPVHQQLFFSLYFMMTGLHALHMLIGLGIMGTMLWWAYAGLLHAGRGLGPVLALRRHRLDFPVPAALSARRAPRRARRLRSPCPTTAIPSFRSAPTSWCSWAW
jgi:cytochrome c oxidase subunit 3